MSEVQQTTEESEAVEECMELLAWTVQVIRKSYCS